MGVTGHVTDVEPRLVEIDRLVNSHTLHGSESLCKLLRYLADHAIRKPGVALKEYQIATEVFGRPADFDPQLGFTGSRAGGASPLEDCRILRLRRRPKIPSWLNCPKELTLLAFHPALRLPAKNCVRGMHEPDDGKSGRSASPILRARYSILSILLVIHSSPSPGYSRAESHPTDHRQLMRAHPPAFRVFWHAFATGPDAPWVIFSNGAFIGRPETGLRYFDPAARFAGGDLRPLHRRGRGPGGLRLEPGFRPVAPRIRVKRGSLFSLDDAQNNNLIFVGSPAENLSLRDIPSTHQFVFQRATSGSAKRRPRHSQCCSREPDEPKSFSPAPQAHR